MLGLGALFTALRPLWSVTESTPPATPTAPAALCTQGYGLMNQWPVRAVEAAELFEQGLRSGVCVVDARFGLGWAAQAQGHDAEAQALYARALDEAHAAARVDLEYFTLHNLGVLHLDHGRPQQALDVIRRGIAIASTNDAVPRDRLWADSQNAGRALVRLGRAPEAVLEFDVALRAHPDDPALLAERARAAAALK